MKKKTFKQFKKSIEQAKPLPSEEHPALCNCDPITMKGLY
jgi:hypothetical protein